MRWGPRAVEGVHPHRLAVAAHEIGHLMLWSRIEGVRPRQVQLGHSRTDPDGFVDMDWSGAVETEQACHDYVAGFLAGQEAYRLWVLSRGETLNHWVLRRSGSWDMRAFRRVRRHSPQARAWTEKQLRRDAGLVLSQHWSLLEECTERLACNGRLDPNALIGRIGS